MLYSNCYTYYRLNDDYGKSYNIYYNHMINHNNYNNHTVIIIDTINANILIILILIHMEVHWKIPLEIHWTIIVNIHWTSDNPLGTTTEQRNYVGKCHCHYPKYDDNVSFQGLLKFAPT